MVAIGVPVITLAAVLGASVVGIYLVERKARKERHIMGGNGYSNGSNGKVTTIEIIEVAYLNYVRKRMSQLPSDWGMWVSTQEAESVLSRELGVSNDILVDALNNLTSKHIMEEKVERGVIWVRALNSRSSNGHNGYSNGTSEQQIINELTNIVGQPAQPAIASSEAQTISQLASMVSCPPGCQTQYGTMPVAQQYIPQLPTGATTVAADPVSIVAQAVAQSMPEVTEITRLGVELGKTPAGQKYWESLAYWWMQNADSLKEINPQIIASMREVAMAPTTQMETIGNQNITKLKETLDFWTKNQDRLQESGYKIVDVYQGGAEWRRSVVSQWSSMWSGETQAWSEAWRKKLLGE
jgi:hypothetical protein